MGRRSNGGETAERKPRAVNTQALSPLTLSPLRDHTENACMDARIISIRSSHRWATELSTGQYPRSCQAHPSRLNYVKRHQKLNVLLQLLSFLCCLFPLRLRKTQTLPMGRTGREVRAVVYE